jgi:hypothetical protein
LISVCLARAAHGGELAEVLFEAGSEDDLQDPA